MGKEAEKIQKKAQKLFTKGRTVILAYDQGLEHGPKDFSGKNANPSYILDIAKKAKLNAIILQKGVAEKYYTKEDVPLILKLNGKTSLFKGEPISRQICSVREAKELGAFAVGYTIYIGSSHESLMLHEFSKIQEEAHKLGMPVIAWMYPRGKSVKEVTPEIIEYAARIGLEIGADFVKIPFTNKEHFKKVVKEAGRCYVLALGGKKTTKKKILKEAKDVWESGAVGMAIGRNIWESSDPVGVAKEIKQIFY